jgi:hypothetical protein
MSQTNSTAVHDDLFHFKFPELNWGVDKNLIALQNLFEYLASLAEGTIQWYIWSKQKKKKWAILIRLLAIFAGAVAGLIPMLSEIITISGKTIIHPVWASIALGVMAALVLLDRFFGYSSAWMRFIQAELQIRKLQQEFVLDWEISKAAWEGKEPSSECVQNSLTKFKSFLSQINELILQETSVWIQEFQKTLSLMDEASKSRPAIVEAGAVNITVTNADLCKNGWILCIDGGNPQKYTCKTAAIKNLIVGMHIVRAQQDTQEQKRLSAEAAVNIVSGTSTSLELTLT